MRSHIRTAFVLALAALGIGPQTPANGDEPNPDKLYLAALKPTAYVAVRDKDGAFVREAAGVLLGKDQKYLLTTDLSDAKVVRVQFATFSKDAEPVTELTHYREQVANKDAVTGTVVFRDERRAIALVRLDRIPNAVVPIVLAQTVRVGSQVWRIGLAEGAALAWEFVDGHVRFLGRLEDFDRGPPPDKPGPRQITASTATAAKVTGPLINGAGELVGWAIPFRTPLDNKQKVSAYLDVSEVRSALTEHKIKLGK